MYSEKTWNYWVLIPFWILHFMLLFAFIAVFAVDMMEAAGDLGYEPAALSAFMFFFCVALISEPLEMVFQSYRLLTPVVYLSLQTYKALLSSICLIVQVVAYVKNIRSAPGIWKWVEIVLLIELILLAVSFYGSLAYGIVVFRRHRKATAWYRTKDQSVEVD